MLRPDVIDGPSGRLLTVVHGPDGGTATAAVVVVPPFAEEMNKSRRMLTLFAAAAGVRGYETVVPDLTGTGDSDGDFEDARWDLWCEDLARVLARARARTGRAPALLAVRSGALLASAVLERDASACAELLLWAPATDGDRFMKQFLRLRMAATLTHAHRETVADLENALRSGRSLEVGGYCLSTRLWSAFIERRFAPPSAGQRAYWFDVLTGEPAALSPASQKGAAQLQAAGWRVDARALSGPAFWATAEIAEVPALIAASAAALEAAA